MNHDTNFVGQALHKLFPGKTAAQLTMKQLSEVMRTAQELKAGKFAQPLAANRTAPARYASET
jgi:hypothetical protein